MGGSRVLALAAAGTVAAFAAGCGAAHSVSDAVDPVAQAAQTTLRAGTVEMRIDAVSKVGGRRVPVTGTGVVSTRGSRGRFVVRTGRGAAALRFVEIYDGNDLYLGNPRLARRLGKPWAKIDFSRLTKTRNAIYDAGSNAATALRVLRAAGHSSRIGAETVDGASTVHYRSLAGGAPVDAWIDGTHHVRRLAIAVKGPSPTRLSMDFVRFGVPLHVTIPRASRVADITSQARSVLGG